MLKRKAEICFYSFYDITGMQKHLKKQASKGWFIDQIIDGIWFYHRDEPVKVHYTVLYDPKAKRFQSEATEEQLEFRDFLDETGWEHVLSSDRLQIFISTEKEPVPVYTDAKSMIDGITFANECVHTGYGVSIILLFMLSLVYGISTFNKNPLLFLGNGMYQMFVLSLGAMVLYLAAVFIGYIIWQRKAEKFAENDEFLCPDCRGQRALGKFVGIIFLLTVAVVLTSGNLKAQLIALFVIVSAVVMVIVTGLITKHMKKKHQSSAKTAVVYVVVFYIIVGLMNMAIIFDVFSYMIPDAVTKDLANPKIISFERLNEEEDLRENLTVQHAKSLMMKTTEVTQFKPDDGYLNYVVADSKTDGLAGYLVEYFLHEYDGQYMDYNEDEMTGKSVTPKEVNAAVWKADKAWKLENFADGREAYILVYGNKVVKFDIEAELTDEQKAFCAEQF